MQGMLPAAGRKVQSCLMVLTIGLIAGCVDPTIYRPDTTAPEERRALDAELGGRHAEAAERYAQLAGAAQGDERISYLIRSAEQWLAAEQPRAARQRLRDIGTPADPSLAGRLTIALGRLDLLEGAPQQALDRIDALGNTLPTSQIGNALGVRGQALFQLDRPTAAVTALVERETWLTRSEQVFDNQRLICRA